ncbi:hypothetical protein SAMN05660284_01827 [Formivibrio citricus]|uniref:Uncharacterized protein n=1 Tax=Formivibrio citricus TaxID=83765 RepID=A0A1I5A633_9NEIS|nr:hypothetical protein SAMN05660284_01827 [Formivibrio citricus]
MDAPRQRAVLLNNSFADCIRSHRPSPWQTTFLIPSASAEEAERDPGSRPTEGSPEGRKGNAEQVGEKVQGKEPGAQKPQCMWVYMRISSTARRRHAPSQQLFRGFQGGVALGMKGNWRDNSPFP